MSEEIKQGVTDSSVTPTEQTTAENNVDNSSSFAYSQTSQGSGVNTAVGKTYTEEEVNQILHARTKEYSEKLKKYESLIGNSQKNENENALEELSQEDIAFMNYFKSKILPKIQSELLPKEQVEFLSGLMERERASTNMFLKDGESIIKDLSVKNGLSEDKIDMVKDIVASVILNNPDLQSRFIMRDKTVFEEAYKRFYGMFSKVIEENAKSKVKNIIDTKTNVANIKQPIKEGVGAAITEKKPLSDSELIEKAFSMLNKK